MDFRLFRDSHCYFRAFLPLENLFPGLCLSNVADSLSIWTNLRCDPTTMHAASEWRVINVPSFICVRLWGAEGGGLHPREGEGGEGPTQ